MLVTGDRRRPPPGLSLSPSKFGLYYDKRTKIVDFGLWLERAMCPGLGDIETKINPWLIHRLAYTLHSVFALSTLNVVE